MLELIRRYWLSVIGWILFLPVALRIFMRWTTIGIFISTIPIEKFLVSRFSWPPITTRLVLWTVAVIMSWVSWHVAEITVALISMALVIEFCMLRDSVVARIREWRETQEAEEALA